MAASADDELYSPIRPKKEQEPEDIDLPKEFKRIIQIIKEKHKKEDEAIIEEFENVTYCD